MYSITYYTDCLIWNVIYREYLQDGYFTASRTICHCIIAIDLVQNSHGSSCAMYLTQISCQDWSRYFIFSTIISEDLNKLNSVRGIFKYNNQWKMVLILTSISGLSLYIRTQCLSLLNILIRYNYEQVRVLLDSLYLLHILRS